MGSGGDSLDSTYFRYVVVGVELRRNLWGPVVLKSSCNLRLDVPVSNESLSPTPCPDIFESLAPTPCYVEPIPRTDICGGWFLIYDMRAYLVARVRAYLVARAAWLASLA